MKKLINILFLVFFTTQILHAQRIEQVFVQMPDVLNPVISRQQRVELLEFFKAEMGDSIRNRFGTQTRLLKLDAENNHIVLQNTDISTIEIKLIPHRNDTIIGFIRTVCSQICQSSISFFNLRWQPRVDISFTFPQAVDWIIPEQLAESNLNSRQVQNILQTGFISLAFDGATNQIIATNNSLQFLDQTNQELIAPLMNNVTLMYRLGNNRRWERN